MEELEWKAPEWAGQAPCLSERIPRAALPAALDTLGTGWPHGPLRRQPWGCRVPSSQADAQRRKECMTWRSSRKDKAWPFFVLCSVSGSLCLNLGGEKGHGACVVSIKLTGGPPSGLMPPSLRTGLVITLSAVGVSDLLRAAAHGLISSKESRTTKHPICLGLWGFPGGKSF